jgi:hypothetical protein
LSSRLEKQAQSVRANICKDAAAGVVGSQSATVVLASYVALVRAEAAANDRVRTRPDAAGAVVATASAAARERVPAVADCGPRVCAEPRCRGVCRARVELRHACLSGLAAW